MSKDGRTIAIGARFNSGNGNNAGHVRIFDWSGIAWVQRGLDIDGEAASSNSGAAVSMSDDGYKVAIGAPCNRANIQPETCVGHVRIFDWK
jgi:hypothetical protein